MSFKTNLGKSLLVVPSPVSISHFSKTLPGLINLSSDELIVGNSAP